VRDGLGVESRAKGHGKVFHFPRPDRLPDAFADWEDAAAPRPNAEGFLSAPGMFSHAHADPGSRLLAGALAGRLSGRVAELGGGYGWLAAQLLQGCPGIEALTLFEADHAACEAARANLSDPRAAVRWADVTALGPADGPFERAVTNPPFHGARAPDPALGRAFIAAAARILGTKGRLDLVANRHLPYESALEAGFQEWRQEALEAGYKILSAVRPRGPKGRR
jgi:16S rRNA (guanine1207-N2)-methyltransferase